MGLENSVDKEIWNYAKSNGFTILTFDADLSNIYGNPPKIIWLRTGNMSTNNIAKTIKKHQQLILDFCNIDDYEKIDCLEIE